MIRVKDEPDLARDVNGAIKNINVDEYRLFIERRNAALNNKNRIDKLEEDVSNINYTLRRILELLGDDRK